MRMYSDCKRHKASSKLDALTVPSPLVVDVDTNPVLEPCRQLLTDRHIILSLVDAAEQQIIFKSEKWQILNVAVHGCRKELLRGLAQRHEYYMDEFAVFVLRAGGVTDYKGALQAFRG